MPGYVATLLLSLLTVCPVWAQTISPAAAPLSPAGAPGFGISRELAVARTARLSDLRYELGFAVKAGTPAVDGTEVLTFTATAVGGDLYLDYRDGALLSAELNGHPVASALIDGHLRLPAEALVAGQNRLKVAFVSQSAAAGRAITRYADKDDGSEYVYTLFVPMDASMAFPCFDQPDLKARFTLAVTHPAGWTVVGNTAGTASSTTVTRFAETRPISTYLFAFAAGPFARIASMTADGPAMYVRKSQGARARTEAPEVQAMAAHGIAWLSEYFAQPFPFPKYDLVLIPGFPFGGMEHAGATFLNEDGVLFRSTPTQSDYFRRDVLVLHETTHQWFGDLVTMRWFDDLWLKEGFAQYMAYKAMAALKPDTQPWKHFAEDIKPLAYGIDETQGTTPIFQNIPNLKDAKSAYGAIVYQKAPAILKQLDFYIGDEAFRDGLRIYLKEHAYGNATWPDLIGAFEQAGAKNLKTWADAWVLRRGMPEVRVALACDGGRVVSLRLIESDVLPDHSTWPMATEVLLQGSDKARRLRVFLSEPTTTVSKAVGLPCPRYVFANAGDQAYGHFLLDARSETAVTTDLRAETDASATADPLLHTQLWTALWENVRVAQTAPASYAGLALETLPREPDESINRIQGGRVGVSLHAYLGPKSRAALLPEAEGAVADRMLHAPALDVRIANFRAFTNIAETPAALGELKQLLAGTLQVQGLTLKPLDRWNLVGHLLQMHDPEGQALYAAESAKDHSGEAQKYAYAAMAGTPDAAVKARYFAEYLTSKTVQEDWITQSLRPFNGWNQQALTLPYLERALNALPEIKRNRKIFFLGVWLGSFIDGQSTPDAQAVVHGWLAGKDIDADLRLKVLEQSDALDRTVMIRKKFPE